MIVEDNPTNARILTTQAGKWGMTTRTAQSAQEALSWLRAGETFDLALVDMQMPAMDGLMLAREIRKLPGAMMSVRPVGVLLMEDEAGGDEKIIAVPSSKLTQRYDKVRRYSDLPDITLAQIQHFFEHYKDLEDGKWVKVLRWGAAEDAHRLIEEAIARAKGK